ncbi:hypothetical protein HZB00_03015, partial [Candidatus Woesearchaeota archaeon]|nr:hypothetical protein [Candidatus Woesearchaeota archaeon]
MISDIKLLRPGYEKAKETLEKIALAELNKEVEAVIYTTVGQQMRFHFGYEDRFVEPL